MSSSNPLQRMWESIDNKGNYWLIVIVLLALALRMYIVFTMDISHHLEIHKHRFGFAQNIIDGHGLSRCTNHFPLCKTGLNDQSASVGPVPVLVYAAAIYIFDDRAKSAIVTLQIILSIASIVLIYLLSMKIFNNRSAAILAAMLMAFYPPLITLSLRMEAETIFIFLLSLSFLTLMQAYDKRQWLYWAIAGICLALTAMSRLSFVYFPFVITLILPLLFNTSIKDRLSQAGVLILAFSLTLSPWVIRNYKVFDEFVLGSTLTGYNLFRHNHIVSSDDYLRYVGSIEGKEAVSNLLKNQNSLRGDENEAQMDAFYKQESIRIIKLHFDRYFILSSFRFLPLWTGRGIYEEYLRKVGIENLILLILALTTAFYYRNTHLFGISIVVLLIAYYTSAHMLVTAQLRYIVPVIPFVMILASITISSLISKLLSVSSSSLDRKRIDRR